MSDKTAGKSKNQPLYRTAKRPGKKVSHGAALAPGKGYGVGVGSAGLRMQETFLGSGGGGGLVAEAEEPALASKEEQESDLADELVSDLADTGPDVNALCETYKLRREELGRLTGFSLRALAEWASGKFPSQPARRRLHEVRRLLDALAEIVEPEKIPKWLHQPNSAFDRLTPLQVIELGEIDRLWAMVYDLSSGQPN